MTHPHTDRTDESTDRSIDRSIDDRPGLERRPLLKTLGAGTAISFGSTVTTASDDESDDDVTADDEDGADADSRGIHPIYGYPTTDAAELPEEFAPAHEVELTVSPPGPGQPPLLYFDPVGLRVDSGDIVQFSFSSPDHTVTAMHPDIGLPRRVPEAANPFSSPVQGPGAAWLYRFEHEGVYDIYCAPHFDLGMVMRIVVGELSADGIPDYAQTVEGLPSKEDASSGLNEMSEQNEDCEWPYLMPAAVLGTDALDPMTIQASGEVPFETVAEELGYELLEEEGGAETAGPTVQTLDHPDYGEILVGPDEMTLYMFDQDTQNAGESACYDDCSDAWPPLTVEEEPVSSEGVTAELATFERETGERQVTANGWPLYYFARDEEPGDVRGQGVNDVWWVLGPDGTPVRSDSSD